MLLLLNIDTATANASVCLSRNDEILGMAKNPDQKSHASFIQPAIKDLFLKAELSLTAIDAVGVTAGPGSYTGLRVGLATAKGLCYALNKPLILINTLEVMVAAVIKETPEAENYLFCPMIDARRMEVFTAVYNKDIEYLLEPEAMLLSEKSFENFLIKPIIFSGDGHIKLKKIINNSNALFSEVQYNATHLVPFTLKAFFLKRFADVASSTPFYLKEFFTPLRKSK